jgi:NADH:ubiquinone oxidoreductase subunit 3 (subunit A)
MANGLLNTGVALLAFTLVGIAATAVVVFLSWCVRPLRERASAQATYECGFPAQGERRTLGFSYFSYAALFLLFDLAVLYLYLYSTDRTLWPETIWWFLGGLATLLVAIAAAARGVMTRAA